MSIASIRTRVNPSVDRSVRADLDAGAAEALSGIQAALWRGDRPTAASRLAQLNALGYVADQMGPDLYRVRPRRQESRA
jgi:hypothetical protein